MMTPYMKQAFFLLITATLVRAQSVDSLVSEGLRNNPQLKSFQYQIQASGFRANSSQALPAPTIGVEFSQIPSNSVNVMNDATSNNFSLSQMFMLGGKLSAMSDVEKKKGNVLSQNLGTLEVQLRASIKMNYFQLWLVERQIEVQRRTISLLNDLEHAMQSQVQTNRMRQADLLTIRAEISSEQSKLIGMQSQRNSVQNTLRSLLGRDDFSSTISTEVSLSVHPISISEFQLSEKIKLANPSLIAMDKMKEMNESMIIAAQKELIPDLMVQAMVMRMPNGMILTGGSRSAAAIQQSAAGMPMQQTEWMYSIMASITLPFAPWSAERSTGKVDEIQATNLSINAEKDAMQRQMLATLRSAINKYETADTLSHRYAQTIIPLMNEAADAQTIAYQTGQAPISTVLDARRMELMKQDEYLMTQVDRQMALVEIEMMVGTPVH